MHLNPGGVVDHKYAAEQAVLASGVPFSFIKPVGELIVSIPYWACPGLEALRGCAKTQ